MDEAGTAAIAESVAVLRQAGARLAICTAAVPPAGSVRDLTSISPRISATGRLADLGDLDAFVRAVAEYVNRPS